MRRAFAVSVACALPLGLYSLLLTASRSLLERQRALLRRLWALLGRLSAASPLPAVELLACVLMLVAALMLITAAARALRMRSFRPLERLMAGLLCVTLPFGSVFYALWPVHADRPASAAAAYARAYPLSELEEMILALDGRMLAGEELIDLSGPFARLGEAHELAGRAAAAYAQSGLDAQPPRLARWPQWLERLRAAGMFIPLTGEAVVSPRDLDSALAFTMLHELAHAQGMLREDEANLLALRVGLGCEDAGLRWASGVTLLRYSLETLRSLDEERFERMLKRISPAARRELIAQGAFTLPASAHNAWAYGAHERGATAAAALAREPAFVRAGGEGAYDGVVYLLLAEGPGALDDASPTP